MSERPLADILADAWRLRDELDAAAIRAASAKIETLPDGVQDALREATAALYFGPGTFEARLEKIIRALDPDLYRVLDERGAKAAYDVARGEEA